MTSPADGFHLAMVGLPGSGKSTTGRLVAAKLNVPFLDFDSEIERREGQTIAQIFATSGEDHFRDLEAALSSEVATQPPMVLSPGGGWVTRPEAMDVLRGRTRIIWLRVSPERAVRRMGRNVSRRPLLSGPDPVGQIVRLDAERTDAYMRCDASFNTEVLALHDVVDEIARLATFWGLRVG